MSDASPRPPALHAIAATHPRADDDDECAAEYKRRIACDPERLSNLRFAFAIVLAGVRESKQAMQKTRFDEDSKIDASTRELVQGLFDDHSFMDGENIKRVAPLLRAAAAQASECSVLTNEDDDEWLERIRKPEGSPNKVFRETTRFSFGFQPDHKLGREFDPGSPSNPNRASTEAVRVDVDVARNAM